MFSRRSETLALRLMKCSYSFYCLIVANMINFPSVKYIQGFDTMTEPKQLPQVLNEWASLFMQRSMQEFTHLMQESGLSMAQLSTLMRLFYGGACGVSHIGDQLGVTAAAASKMIDRLVQQGLLARAEDPTDRRAKNVTVTPAGAAVVQQAIAARQAWLANLTHLLQPEEQAIIIDALTKLTEAGRQLLERSAAAGTQGENL